MADTNFIHQLLHLNGVGPDASDDELRALFLKAGWSEQDIAKTISSFRHPERVAVEKERPLSPGQSHTGDSSDRISSLLGIDIVVDPSMIRDRITHQLTKERRGFYALLRLWGMLLVVATVLAFAASWAAFYFLDIGPFKSTAAEGLDW